MASKKSRMPRSLLRSGGCAMTTSLPSSAIITSASTKLTTPLRSASSNLARLLVAWLKIYLAWAEVRGGYRQIFPWSGPYRFFRWKRKGRHRQQSCEHAKKALAKLADAG
eukprot:3783799-Prorocentrum_lima.AAC.1